MGSFREEFTRTERTLARHTGAIRERLIQAAEGGIGSLSNNQWELDKMPEDLRERFLKLMEKLKKRGGSDVGGESVIRGTVKEMSDSEAQILVDEFLALSDDVRELPFS